MWLDHGCAFLTINYRGSTSFGKAFEQAIYGDLGRLEVDDMAAARDFLVREGIALPDSILVTGWSYGGYLTLMALGARPELWAGGMAGIAVADWAVQYAECAAQSWDGKRLKQEQHCEDERQTGYAVEQHACSPFTSGVEAPETTDLRSMSGW